MFHPGIIQVFPIFTKPELLGSRRGPHGAQEVDREVDRAVTAEVGGQGCGGAQGTTLFLEIASGVSRLESCLSDVIQNSFLHIMKYYVYIYIYIYTNMFKIYTYIYIYVNIYIYIYM